jgi:hypothetical protein
MRRTRSKLFAMPVAIATVVAPFLMNCGSLPGGLPGPAGDLVDAAGGCPEMESGDFAKLSVAGGAQVEGKVKSFLEASFTLDKLIADMEVSLIASCGELGKELGMSDAELKAAPKGGEGAKKVCGAVAAKIDGILKANAGAKLSLEIGEPSCYVNIDAMTDCLGKCGSPVDPGKVEASCEGGEISGQCSAECKGSCTVEAGAECSGACSAKCEGKCEASFKGTCGGKCDGKCDGKNTKGKCEGTCEGKCDAGASGSCGGTCEGSCSASCKMEGKADCKGSCSGGCSAKVEEPQCSGEFKPPSVDPSCQLSCTAKGIASAKCDPPTVKVKVSGKANAEIDKLVVALSVALPKIAAIQLGAAKQIGASAAGVVKAGADVKDVAASAGAKALVCIGVAAEAAVSASASIDVNVEASASVSASAEGSASAG